MYFVGLNCKQPLRPAKKRSSGCVFSCLQAVQNRAFRPLVAGAGTVYADRFPTDATLAEDHYMPEAIDAFSLLDSAAWQPPLQGIELHYLRNDVVQA